MKTLRQVVPITEDVAPPKIHWGTSVDKLKDVAKNSSFREANFAIDALNGLNVGDAGVFGHHQLGYGTKTKGRVKYDKTTDTFKAMKYKDTKDHPMFKRWLGRGIQMVSPEDYWAKPLEEMSRTKVFQYINKAQDASRYFADPQRLETRLNSFITAQKKVGYSKTKARVPAKEKPRSEIP